MVRYFPQRQIDLNGFGITRKIRKSLPHEVRHKNELLLILWQINFHRCDIFYKERSTKTALE